MSKKIYICPSFSAVERQMIVNNIYERIPDAQITESIKEATLIIDKAPTPEKFFTKGIELSDNFDVPVIMQKPIKKIRKPTTADLIKATTDLRERKNKEIYIQNQIKNTYQKYNQIRFGRTKHK